MRGFVLEKWAIGSLKESRAQNIARKPVWPQKKSNVHVFRNKHECIDYCRGKVLRIYWYILSALTIYIDVTSPSFCGRSQLCNDPDTYQALGSVERRHRIYEEKYEWKNHDVLYVTTEMRTRFQIFERMFFLTYVSQEIPTPKPPHILPMYSCRYHHIQKRCIEVFFPRCIVVDMLVPLPWGKSNPFDSDTSWLKIKRYLCVSTSWFALLSGYQP